MCGSVDNESDSLTKIQSEREASREREMQKQFSERDEIKSGCAGRHACWCIPLLPRWHYFHAPTKKNSWTPLHKFFLYDIINPALSIFIRLCVHQIRSGIVFFFCDWNSSRPPCCCGLYFIIPIQGKKKDWLRVNNYQLTHFEMLLLIAVLRNSRL